MTGFRDRALLELSDPATLGALLLPAGDTRGERVRTMLAVTYDLSAARVDRVRSAQVQEIALQRALFPSGRLNGMWSQTVPSYTRGDLTLNVPAPADPIWVDLLAQLDVTVVIEADPGGAEAVLSRGFDDFATLDDFRARFSFFDLDAFLARHRISTVEELREAFDYVVADVQLRTLPEFDPNDPANSHTLPVTLAAVIVDPFDLAEGLRATRLVREAARELTGGTPTSIPTELTEAYATAVVVAEGSVGGGPAAADIERLFAREGVVSLFLAAN
ncbi:hypothetical protein QMK19_18045 [Streptomyces sp. H10-C2]|nr:hypothetical protein [Streptomyces sp. H10-C2]